MYMSLAGLGPSYRTQACPAMEAQSEHKHRLRKAVTTSHKRHHFSSAPNRDEECPKKGQTHSRCLRQKAPVVQQRHQMQKSEAEDAALAKSSIFTLSVSTLEGKTKSLSLKKLPFCTDSN